MLPWKCYIGTFSRKHRQPKGDGEAREVDLVQSPHIKSHRNWDTGQGKRRNACTLKGMVAISIQNNFLIPWRIPPSSAYKNRNGVFYLICNCRTAFPLWKRSHQMPLRPLISAFGFCVHNHLGNKPLNRCFGIFQPLHRPLRDWVSKETRNITASSRLWPPVTSVGTPTDSFPSRPLMAQATASAIRVLHCTTNCSGDICPKPLP